MTRIVHSLVHNLVHTVIGSRRRTMQLTQGDEWVPEGKQDWLCSAPLGSKARPCSLSDEMPAPPAGVKGRTRSERGAETGDGAEGPEATAVPTITVAAPRSDPGRRPVARADLFRPREHRTAIDRAWVDSALTAGVAPVGDTGPGSLTIASTTVVGPGRTPQV